MGYHPERRARRTERRALDPLCRRDHRERLCCALVHRLSARRGGWPIPNSQGEPKPRVRALITRRDEEYTARRDSNRKLAGETPEPKRVSGGLFVARAKGQSESLIKTSNRSIRASTIASASYSP